MIYPRIKPMTTVLKSKSIDEWFLFDPCWNAPQSIIVFGDDIKQHELLKNRWFICGTRKGNLRLVHEDRTTTILSIAKWKVVEHLFIGSPNDLKLDK